MLVTKNYKIIIIIGMLFLLAIFIIIIQNTGDDDLSANDALQKNTTAPTAVAGDKVNNSSNIIENLEYFSTQKQAGVDNEFFKVRVGTYWIYSGAGLKLKDNNINEYKINIKHEVISILGERDNYIIAVKTTDLIDSTTKNEKIILKKDYLIFEVDGFKKYIKFPLQVNSRWPDTFGESNDTENLREDGFYQNKINWQLDHKVLDNDCYNIIEQTLSDKSETIWCNQIGPIYDTYHHNGSPDDRSIKLIKYHF